MRYFSDGDIQAAELPYKNVFGKFSENGEYLGLDDFSNIDVSMFLLMSDNEIENAETLLCSAVFENRYVDLSIPKFKIEFSTSLNDIMQKMGVVSAFSEKNADFSNMFEEKGMFISDTIHKTYISVDEKGTEAAAVTGIGMGGSSMPPEPIEVKFNKPFTFVIRDNSNGEILFMGEYSYIS